MRQNLERTVTSIKDTFYAEHLDLMTKDEKIGLAVRWYMEDVLLELINIKRAPEQDQDARMQQLVKNTRVSEKFFWELIK